MSEIINNPSQEKHDELNISKKKKNVYNNKIHQGINIYNVEMALDNKSDLI